MEDMVEVTRIELTHTQLMVLREAWMALNPARINGWTDDDSQPITDEWLERIDDILDNAEFNTWRAK